MLFSDVRQVVGEFARGSVRIDDEGVSLGGVDRVVDGVGCSLTYFFLHLTGFVPFLLFLTGSKVPLFPSPLFFYWEKLVFAVGIPLYLFRSFLLYTWAVPVPYCMIWLQLGFQAVDKFVFVWCSATVLLCVCTSTIWAYFMNFFTFCCYMA